LLNGQEVTLRADTLLIADAAGPLALAGVMGGEPSSVTAGTTEIFLECAWFAPEAVAGRARQYGLNSEAAHRFERGVDPAGVVAAMEFVTQTLLDLCGGEAGPVVVSGAVPAPRPPVEVRLARINRVLGQGFDAAAVAAIFTRLGVAFTEAQGVFTVRPPSHRFDLAIEADFIEEVARLHGYDNIPGVAPTSRLQLLPAPEATRGRLQVARDLVARDYQEIITYSFVEPAWERDFASNAQPVAVINPIAAQMSVMRSTLAGGLIATLVFNLKRKQERVRLFEIGRTFAHDGQGGYAQVTRLGLLAYGSVQPEQWGEGSRRADFFDLKGDLEALVPGLQCRPARHAALHPGRSAELLLDEQVVGWLGELHPALQASQDLPNAPIVGEIVLEAVLRAQVPRFTEPSRFPPVRRDVAVVVDDSVPAQDLLKALDASRPAVVTDIGLFDLYRGKGLPEGQKSLAFRIVIQDTARTLTDPEIDQVVIALTQLLAERFGAELRK
jgi:phenylalanyl-tRNA synthetase beta chain